MSAVATSPKPFRFAGFPLGVWGFALRNWTAMMLALYVAFWLQLESASSAATCVGILSLQTRGQAFNKAVYRMVGTVVGVVASIAIAGVFSQTRDLFFLACCLWLGLCAVLSSLLDGNRAYGTILSGYTVAIVALPNVDTPLDTFSSGINRGAAITIGILAVAVVSDLFWAPALFPSVLGKVEAAQGKVRDFAIQALRAGRATPEAAAALMKELTAFRPDINALPSESLPGRARAMAAGAAVVSLLRVISAARVVAGALAAMGAAGDEPRENLLRALEGRPHESVRKRGLAVMGNAEAHPNHLIAAASCFVLFEQLAEASEAIAAMRDGSPPGRRVRLHLYKSRNAALLNGLRAAVALGLTSWIMSLLGWPSAVTSLVQVGALVGISATNPNPRGFAVGALIAMPLVAAVVGVTEFLVLDGVDQFQLLTLAFGPTIVAGTLLLSAGKPLLFGVGFLLLVYFPVLLSPANPQSYNPQSYLVSSYLSILSVIALFLLLSIVFPLTPAMQRRWMLRSARADLRTAVYGRRRINPLACVFRDADRIGQFGALSQDKAHDSDLLYLLRASDLAGCARRIRDTAEASAMLEPLRPTLADTVASLDPPSLRELGRALLCDSEGRPEASQATLRYVGVQLFLAAVLIERSPRVVRDLRERRR